MHAQELSPEAIEAQLSHLRVAEMAVEVLAAAAAGATTGVLAGPPGIVAGAVLGGAVGVAAGAALHFEHMQQDAHDEQLDRDIGVYGGNIGEARPDAPLSERRSFHLASMGLGGDMGGTPSEGMMQNVDEG